MAVGSFSAGSVRPQCQLDVSERHWQQPGEHQHGRLQDQRGELRGPGQPDGRRHQRQPDAGRPRRRHRRDLAGVRARARSRTRARRPTSPSRAPASSRCVTARASATRAPATSASTTPASLITPDGWRVQGYTQVDPVDRQHRHRRGSRPTSSSRPACCARRRRRPTSGAQVNLDPNVVIDPGEPRVHDVDPDVRRARQPARADRRLQPHRRRRVDLHGRPCRRSTSRASSARRSR